MSGKKSPWPFQVRRRADPKLVVEMLDPPPVPGFKDPRTMSDHELRAEWEQSGAAQVRDSWERDNGIHSDGKIVWEGNRTASDYANWPRSILPAAVADPGGSLSLESSPAVARGPECPRRDLDGPKDRDAGHVPPPLANGGTPPRGGPAGRGLERTEPQYRSGYILDYAKVKLLLTKFRFEKAFAGDQIDPPYGAFVEYESVFVMRGSESFPVDIKNLLGDETLESIEAQVIHEIEGGL